MKVFVTYNNDNQIKKISESELDSEIFHFIDSRTLKGKKEAYKLRSHWGSRIDPFAIVMDDENKPIKAFYSEDTNVIETLLDYLINKRYET